jgi:hypothetical protein
MTRITLLAILLLIVGCTLVARRTLDERYGTPDPGRYDVPVASPQISYRSDIQPILDRRCVVCHGCYDAPCQLKLTAWEGVARGASEKPVYDGGRLVEAAPTRLFIDAQTASEWRSRGFHPVLNERSPTPAANRSASVLFRMLDLKERHPLPAVDVLPGTFDFSLDRKQQCVAIEDFDRYERDYPLWGMPFGFSGLSDSERATLTGWLEQGAPFEGPAPLPPAIESEVRQWEQFLNGDTLKEQLTSRYLFEHLFLAHLHFDSGPDTHYFRLVRSGTPPGQAVREIATRRPYDDPGVSRVYYRLTPERETLVAKTHMPYALNPARMALG